MAFFFTSSGHVRGGCVATVGPKKCAPAAAAPICVIERPERGNEHTGAASSAMPKHVTITAVSALGGKISVNSSH